MMEQRAARGGWGGAGG